MDTMIMKKDLFQEEEERKNLIYQAKEQMLNDGKVTVRCPRCKKVPKVIVKGKYNEHIIVKCDCNYLFEIEKGI